MTILFADLVDSTARGSERDPETVRASLATAFAEIRAIVLEHGGTLEKFIGDAVMAVFGAPVAYDDHADRAVRAACGVRDAIGRTAASAFPMAVRIGLSSGEVVAGAPGEGHHIVTGHSVNVAARLEVAATAGEILAGPLTRRLTSMTVVYGEERLVEAKGAGQIAAAPVVGLVKAGRLLAVAPSATPFVGRDAVLAQLRVSAEACARDRTPKMISITGPPGQGKSRLFHEFARGRADVWRIRCLPYGRGRAYAPIRELMLSELALPETPSFEEAARAIEAQVPSLALDRPGLGDAATRTLAEFVSGSAVPARADDLRWAFQRYFEARARSAPAVLGVEDAHWADPALLALLSHLGRAARAPLLIVCLARPELHLEHPRWPDQPSVRVDLPPLNSEDSRSLAQVLLPADLQRPAEVVATLSEGNPLYIEELSHLVQDFRPAVGPGGELHLPAVPASLHGIIAARIDRSGELAKVVCQHASVIGTTVEPAQLAALLPTDVEAGIREALRREILAPTAGGVRFRHVLIRDVAYRSLPKAQRSGLHERYARWLEATGRVSSETRDLVAFHAEQAHALVRELERPCEDVGEYAAAALLRSARDRSRGDATATLTLYERANSAAHSIHLSDRDRQDIAANIAMLRYDIFGGAPEIEAMDEVIRATRDKGPSAPLVRLLDQRAWIEVQSGSIDRAGRLYDEALQMARSLGDPVLTVEALLAPGEIAMFTGDLAGREADLAEALAIATAHGLKQQRASVLRSLAFLDFQAGRYTTSSKRKAEADELDPPTDPAQRAAAAEDASYRAHITGSFARAVDLARDAVAIADEIGSRTIRGRCYRVLAEALYSAGDHYQAEVASATAMSAFDPSMSGHLCEVESELALIRVASGDLAGARRAMELSLGHLVAHDVHGKATYLGARAALLAAERADTQAEAAFREALELIGATGFGNATMETRRAFAAFLLARGRSEEAREVLGPAIEFFGDPLAAEMRLRLISMGRGEPVRT